MPRMAVSEQAVRLLEREESFSTQLQQHGVQAPIRRLPPEILATIFKNVALDGHYDSYFDCLLLLAKVCLFWNEIVNSTPELWSTISLTSNAAMIDRALITSQHSLIDVVAIFRRQDGVLRQPLGRILHTVLNDTPRRWRSATFDVTNAKVMINIIKALDQASYLQQLRLQLHDSLLFRGLPEGFPFEFWPGPNLQALSIDMGLLRFSDSSLAGLRSLRLTALPYRISYSSKEWLEVLHACPALVELQISKNADILTDDVLGSSQLRSLTTLILQCNMRLTTVILESVSSCRRLRVDINPTSLDAYYRAQFDRELQRHITAIARLVISTAEQEVIVQTTPAGFCLGPSTTSSGDKIPCLEINLRHGSTDHPLLLLETVFNQETLGSRLIRILLVGDTQVGVSAIHSTVLNQWAYTAFGCITTWPRLVSISCSMPRALVKTLLACLAPRHSVDPPCPDLRQLTIDAYHRGHLSVYTVREFFLNRYGSNGTGPQQTPTSPLRCIQVFGWSEVERCSLAHTLENLEIPLPEVEVYNGTLFKDNLIQSRPALIFQPSENFD